MSKNWNFNKKSPETMVFFIQNWKRKFFFHELFFPLASSFPARSLQLRASFSIIYAKELVIPACVSYPCVDTRMHLVHIAYMSVAWKRGHEQTGPITSDYTAISYLPGVPSCSMPKGVYKEQGAEEEKRKEVWTEKPQQKRNASIVEEEKDNEKTVEAAKIVFCGFWSPIHWCKGSWILCV